MPRNLAMANIGSATTIRNLLIEQGWTELPDMVDRVRGRVAYLQTVDDASAAQLIPEVQKAIKQATKAGVRKLFVHASSEAMESDALDAFWVGLGFRYVGEDRDGRPIYARGVARPKAAKAAKPNGRGAAKKAPTGAERLALAHKHGKGDGLAAASQAPAWAIPEGTMAVKVKGVVQYAAERVQADGGHAMFHSGMTRPDWAAWWKGVDAGVREGLAKRLAAKPRSRKPGAAPKAKPRAKAAARPAARSKPRAKANGHRAAGPWQPPRPAAARRR